MPTKKFTCYIFVPTEKSIPSFIPLKANFIFSAHKRDIESFLFIEAHS